MRLQAPRLQEVQQNEGFESAPTSTSQGSLTEIPHTGGFKESVPDVNVLPKDFRGQVPLRTEEKKGKCKSLSYTLYDDFQIIETI